MDLLCGNYSRDFKESDKMKRKMFFLVCTVIGIGMLRTVLAFPGGTGALGECCSGVDNQQCSGCQFLGFGNASGYINLGTNPCPKCETYVNPVLCPTATPVCIVLDGDYKYYASVQGCQAANNPSGAKTLDEYDVKCIGSCNPDSCD